MISRTRYTWLDGGVLGYLKGDLDICQSRIDVSAFAGWAGARLIIGQVSHIDFHRQTVQIITSGVDPTASPPSPQAPGVTDPDAHDTLLPPPLHYDVISVGPGPAFATPPYQMHMHMQLGRERERDTEMGDTQNPLFSHRRRERENPLFREMTRQQRERERERAKQRDRERENDLLDLTTLPRACIFGDADRLLECIERARMRVSLPGMLKPVLVEIYQDEDDPTQPPRGTLTKQGVLAGASGGRYLTVARVVMDCTRDRDSYTDGLCTGVLTSVRQRLVRSADIVHCTLVVRGTGERHADGRAGGGEKGLYKACRDAGIVLLHDRVVSGIDSDTVLLDDGSQLKYDMFIAMTPSRPHPVTVSLALSLSETMTGAERALKWRDAQRERERARLSQYLSEDSEESDMTSVKVPISLQVNEFLELCPRAYSNAFAVGPSATPSCPIPRMCLGPTHMPTDASFDDVHMYSGSRWLGGVLAHNILSKCLTFAPDFHALSASAPSAFKAWFERMRLRKYRYRLDIQTSRLQSKIKRKPPSRKHVKKVSRRFDVGVLEYCASRLITVFDSRCPNPFAEPGFEGFGGHSDAETVEEEGETRYDTGYGRGYESSEEEEWPGSVSITGQGERGTERERERERQGDMDGSQTPLGTKGARARGSRADTTLSPQVLTLSPLSHARSRVFSARNSSARSTRSGTSSTTTGASSHRPRASHRPVVNLTQMGRSIISNTSPSSPLSASVRTDSQREKQRETLRERQSGRVMPPHRGRGRGVDSTTPAASLSVSASRPRRQAPLPPPLSRTVPAIRPTRDSRDTGENRQMVPEPRKALWPSTFGTDDIELDMERERETERDGVVGTLHYSNDCYAGDGERGREREGQRERLPFSSNTAVTVSLSASSGDRERERDSMGLGPAEEIGEDSLSASPTSSLSPSPVYSRAPLVLSLDPQAALSTASRIGGHAALSGLNTSSTSGPRLGVSVPAVPPPRPSRPPPRPSRPPPRPSRAAPRAPVPISAQTGVGSTSSVTIGTSTPSSGSGSYSGPIGTGTIVTLDPPTDSALSHLGDMSHTVDSPSGVESNTNTVQNTTGDSDREAEDGSTVYGHTPPPSFF
ncbi:hypothetical protein KIPB_002844 [Kipferlia bialata]|uniref:Uncharacterized protein n=1 Tax=Kipferlia bialata TaxID=797122 RepID=A0A9K3GGZ7_9EUKA|nr:hypothetical protein KIPB_002844 [Kipferlia bialata]|eukprot:g2844.t1